MDVGRVGSLFIRAVESFLEGNAIHLTLTFKTPIDHDRLADGFRRLVASNESLRLRFEPHVWSLVPPTEVAAALDEQIANLALPADPDTVYADYHATNVGLPIRLKLLDNRRLVLSLNHVFGNGRTALHYLESLLRHYDNEQASTLPAAGRPAAAWFLVRRPAQALTGLFWACAYLSLFAWRAGRSAASTTVDLSRGKKPGEPREGYAIWTYYLSPDDTRTALERSSAAGLTFTENLCQLIAAELFDIQPEKSRVCISVPTDLAAYAPRFSYETPGNFTGALIVQLWRSNRRRDSLDQQVRRAFSWAGRAVHYWVPWLMGQVAGGEAKLSARFLDQAGRPIPLRGPFEDFSCAVSSVGVVQGATSRKYLATVSAHTRTQTVMLCAITLNGRMSIEVSMSLDLFDKPEVMGLTDRAVARLLGSCPDNSIETSRLVPQETARGRHSMA
jgi:hypothetical protein